MVSSMYVYEKLQKYKNQLKLDSPRHTKSVEKASPGSAVHLVDAHLPASPEDHLVVSITF